MGQKQSKDELVFEQVSLGNTEAIKTLRREGAGLEWVDKKGKTPLILASMNAELFNVAKTLIDLGSNVDAYRPGRNGGTPLHHAAKKGLENTVKLLLSHQANPFTMNDDSQTPLGIARAKGFSNVVRAIENHICLFSGWMREFYRPTFLGLPTPQRLSRTVWVVIVPTGSLKPIKPSELELVIYATLKDVKPITRMGLWKAKIKEPKSYQSHSLIKIVDNCKKTRLKFASAIEGDRQQLSWFCDACKGIPPPLNPPMFLQTPQATVPSEHGEFAIRINLSLQSPINQMLNTINHQSIDQTGPSTSTSNAPHVPRKLNSVDFTVQEPSAPPLPNNITPDHDVPVSIDSMLPSSACKNGEEKGCATCLDAAHLPGKVSSIDFTVQEPSAPPLPNNITLEDAPVSRIDSILPSSNCENGGDKGSGGVCAICLDAASEAVCVPCGHVAGCMACLSEIKAKKWGCPLCRADIDQVVKLYRV